MKRHEFEHVIRAAADIAEDEIVVIGSQAVLAQHPNAPAPAGWEGRLVRLELPAIRSRDGTVVAWCLETHDLVLAKLAAGRPHDLEFAEEAMRDDFRLEFLNRIDEVVVFQPLTREQLGAIVELQLARLRERLAERGLDLLTNAAKEAAIEAGWDPTYGARPLKRAIQRLIENPLAPRVLEGDFREGDTVLVDATDGSSCSRRRRPRSRRLSSTT